MQVGLVKAKPIISPKLKYSISKQVLSPVLGVVDVTKVCRRIARIHLALTSVVFAVNPAFASDLSLTITNVPDVPSRMFVALYDSAESMSTNKPKLSKIVDIIGNQTIVVFSGLVAGKYAFVAFADENSNGKLDTNLIGMPTEKYGFSNDVMGLMGPPSFDAASVQFGNDSKMISIKLR